MQREIVTDGTGNSFRLREIECPTCETLDVKRLGMRGGEHHRYGLGVPTEIVRCARCSLLFAHPFPVPVDAQRIYGDPDTYCAGSSEDLRLIARDVVRELKSRTELRPFSLLDVGSGRGQVLAAAREEGVDEVVGLEFAEAMIRYARERYGVEAVRATLEEYAPTRKEPFAAIVLSAIIEHVYDPDSLIRAARELTRPGSVVYIDVPRDPNLLTWIGNSLERVRRRDRVYNLAPTFPPYHLYGFTPRSLKALLEKHDFVIEDLRVYANPRLPASGGAADRLKALLGTGLGVVGNLTHTASNMTVWARRA